MITRISAGVQNAQIQLRLEEKFWIAKIIGKLTITAIAVMDLFWLIVNKELLGKIIELILRLDPKKEGEDSLASITVNGG